MTFTPPFTEIYKGINILIRLDSYLLENNLAERTITHKLGEYYQGLFPDWNVDCEYNKNLGKAKEIIIKPREILRMMADSLEESGYLQSIDIENFHFTENEMRNLEKQLREPKLEYIEELDIIFFILELENGKEIKKNIFPDIIIHHRGTRANNIVLEVKKTSNRNKQARAYDIVKLMTLVSSAEFNYQMGIFIDLPIEKDFKNCVGFNNPVEFTKNVFKIYPLLK